MNELREQIQDPRLRTLLDYWDSKRRDGRLPRRADIDPLEIPSLLPHIMLIDRLAEPERFRYRLVGTAIVEIRQGLTPVDPTGRFVDEVPHRMSVDWLIDGMRRAARNRHPIRDHGTYRPEHDKTGSYERLSLPLADDGETVNMLLLGFVRH